MSDEEATAPSASLLQQMATLAGVDLDDARAAALATQAAPHFALLRALDAIADPQVEPAAEFHLDRWVSRHD